MKELCLPLLTVLSVLLDSRAGLAVVWQCGKPTFKVLFEKHTMRCLQRPTFTIHRSFFFGKRHAPQILIKSIPCLYLVFMYKSTLHGTGRDGLSSMSVPIIVSQSHPSIHLLSVCSSICPSIYLATHPSMYIYLPFYSLPYLTSHRSCTGTHITKP